MMAGYNQHDEPPPVRNLLEVVARQLRMQGFLLPFFPESIQKGLEELHGWVRSGDLEVLENVTHGLDRAPDAFCRLMSGRRSARPCSSSTGPTCTIRAWRPWRGRSAELRLADRRRDRARRRRAPRRSRARRGAARSRRRSPARAARRTAGVARGRRSPTTTTRSPSSRRRSARTSRRRASRRRG